jgi:hypothetical protein
MEIYNMNKITAVLILAILTVSISAEVIITGFTNDSTSISFTITGEIQGINPARQQQIDTIFIGPEGGFGINGLGTATVASFSFVQDLGGGIPLSRAVVDGSSSRNNTIQLTKSPSFENGILENGDQLNHQITVTGLQNVPALDPSDFIIAVGRGDISSTPQSAFEISSSFQPAPEAPAAVPEPSTYFALLLGLISLGIVRKRK